MYWYWFLKPLSNGTPRIGLLLPTTWYDVGQIVYEMPFISLIAYEILNS
jgi:hypothetical protein